MNTRSITSLMLVPVFMLVAIIALFPTTSTRTAHPAPYAYTHDDLTISNDTHHVFSTLDTPAPRVNLSLALARLFPGAYTHPTPALFDAATEELISLAITPPPVAVAAITTDPPEPAPAPIPPPALNPPPVPHDTSSIINILTLAGWPEHLHEQALNIAYCESNWVPTVLGDQGRSLGLFQVQVWNSGWGQKAADAGYITHAEIDQWHDPVVNAKMALYVFHAIGQRWGDPGGWVRCAARYGYF